jgi:hypothetical protein
MEQQVPQPQAQKHTAVPMVPEYQLPEGPQLELLALAVPMVVAD